MRPPERSGRFDPEPVSHPLATQLVGAAEYDVDTYAINQKEESERVAAAAR